MHKMYNTLFPPLLHSIHYPGITYVEYSDLSVEYVLSRIVFFSYLQ